MPTPYHHVACCFEDSEPSRRGLARARELTADGAGRLTLVHVAPTPLLYSAGPAGGWVPDPEDIAEQARAWLAGEVAAVPGADGVLLEGYPPAAVCDWARENDVDLLVAAAHRGIAERVIMGSFASYLAHHAPCDVLLVRPGETTPA